MTALHHLMLLPLLLLQSIQADHTQALALHNAAEARQYAEKLARRGHLEHAPDLNDRGENLFWCSKTPQSPASDASASWVAERARYTHTPDWPNAFYDVGHYTQVVWSTTTHVGIGVATAKDGSTYVVARYFPAGNYTNEMPN